MNTMRFGILKFSVAALGLLACQSRADFIPLTNDTTMDQLTPSGNYTTVGDSTTLVFYSASYNGTGEPIAQSAIGVTEVNSANGAIGFELAGPFSAEGTSTNDVLVSYNMSTSGPGFTQIGLVANGASSGGGQVRVTESVYSDSTETHYLGQIYLSNGGSATLDLDGTYSSLYVKKDIVYNTYSSSDSAGFSYIDQTFTPAIVPEPSSIVLLGLGSSLIGVYRHSRSRRKAVC